MCVLSTTQLRTAHTAQITTHYEKTSSFYSVLNTIPLNPKYRSPSRAAIFACYHADEGNTIDYHIHATPSHTSHSLAFTLSSHPLRAPAYCRAPGGAPGVGWAPPYRARAPFSPPLRYRRHPRRATPGGSSLAITLHSRARLAMRRGCSFSIPMPAAGGARHCARQLRRPPV